MAAAYAAVVSLIHVLENIQSPSMHWILIDRKQTQALHEKVCSLQDFLEDFSNTRSILVIMGLESQIADASHEAEDIIESYVVGQIHDQIDWKNGYFTCFSQVVKRFTCFSQVEKSFTCFCQDIQKVMGKMDLIEQKVIQVGMLFRKKVFQKDGCPLELEEIGKKIAKTCRGLPLALVVIGGLLAKSNKTREYWEYVAENLNSIVNSGNDEHCLKLLSLSYNHLPIHLKPCFLYMATFPEDCEIHVSRLKKLWVPEGFLKPIRTKSLEDVANEYLKDLTDRNLISIRSRYVWRKKICIIHDLLRDLCLREAHKENFLRVIRVENIDIPPQIKSIRHLSIHQSTKEQRYHPQVLNALQCASCTRSLLCEFECSSPRLVSRLNFLRVLDVVDKYSSEDIMKLVNLRYLSFTGDRDLNLSFISSMSLFWNLRDFTLRGETRGIVLPPEIWEMTQLRTLKFEVVYLPDPQPQIGTQNSQILENLQTLSFVTLFRCTEEVVKRMPNLKKLRFGYDKLSSGVEWSYYCLNNLVHLHKLESLKCIFPNKISVGNVAFPHSLKKLSLSGCRLPWEDITVIGSLPRLERLVLFDFAFEGAQWDAIEGEFVELKDLVIHNTDLMHWEADYTHFPSLEILYLGYMLELEEIPLGLAKLPMLQYIHLHHCKPSLVTSAKLILEERDEWEYEGLRVHVRYADSEQWITVTLDDGE